MEENQEKQGLENQENHGSDMTAFIDSFDDESVKKAFKETLNDKGEFDREKIKNLAGRMISDRRTLSKINNMPDSVAKFKEEYKPEERFANLFNEENQAGEKIRKMFDDFDNLCYNNTIGQTKNRLVKDFILKTLADNNIIDVATPEERAAKEEQKAQDQRAILESALGKNTDLDKVEAVINDFISDESMDDPDVKVVLDAIKSSAKGKLILYSLRNRIYGKPVPVMKTEIGTSQKALEKEYNDPNTTRERRAEIAEKLNEMEGIE